MEQYEYQKMYEFEENFWWYKGVRLFIKKEIEKILTNKKNIKILDAGCGTGGNLELLKDINCKDISGFDFNSEAVTFCHRRGFNKVKVGDINKIPFENNLFDFVICINVFECSEVKEKKAFQELVRVLKPGGHLLIVVSAFRFLLSEHDFAVHSIRRYDRSRVRDKFVSRDSDIKEMKYYYFLTFPLIGGVRILKNIFFGKNKEIPQSDLKPVPGWLNKILYKLVFVEEKISHYLNFPFGTSLFVVIKKH